MQPLGPQYRLFNIDLTSHQQYVTISEVYDTGSLETQSRFEDIYTENI